MLHNYAILRINIILNLYISMYVFHKVYIKNIVCVTYAEFGLSNSKNILTFKGFSYSNDKRKKQIFTLIKAFISSNFETMK